MTAATKKTAGEPCTCAGCVKAGWMLANHALRAVKPNGPYGMCYCHGCEAAREYLSDHRGDES